MKEISKTDILLNTINSTVYTIGHFKDIETENKDLIADIGITLLNSLTEEQIVKILDGKLETDPHFWEIRTGDNNDGTSYRESFKGTIYEVEKYLKEEYIGKKHLNKWDKDSDGDYITFYTYPYKKNDGYCELIEARKITEEEFITKTYIT